MTEYGEDYKPKIEHSPRWFFVARVIAKPVMKLATKSEVLDLRDDPDERTTSLLGPAHGGNVDPFSTGLAAYELGFGQVVFLMKEEISRPLGSKLTPESSAAKRAVSAVVDFVPTQVVERIAGHPTKRAGQADKAEINNWAVHELGLGRSVILFPEGTRNREPRAIKEIGDGTAYASIYSGESITPVGNAGTQELGLQRRRKNVIVNVFDEPIHPNDFINPADIGDNEVVRSAAKAITGELHTRMQVVQDEAFNVLDIRKGRAD